MSNRRSNSESAIILRSDMLREKIRKYPEPLTVPRLARLVNELAGVKRPHYEVKKENDND